MGLRGPAPKPTAIRILEGNPSRRPLPTNEPKPPPAIPKPPVHLSTEARREWRRVTIELDRLSMITHVDRALLAVYCESWATWQELRLWLREHKRTYKTPTGEWKTRPEANLLYRAERQIISMANHFGLSPAARSRLTAPGYNDDDGDSVFDV